jgi:thiol:disulfide interchange protein DsbG
MHHWTISRRMRWFLRGALAFGFLLAEPTLAVAHTSEPPEMTAGTFWNHFLPHHITYIQDGHAGPVIYDFQDPNCPYCHVLYEHEAPLIAAGKLTVRYVPVAFLTPQSPAEAAAWLQSPHPLHALKHFETIIGPALRSGSYQSLPKTTPTPATQKILHQNLTIMSEAGFDGTPAILFRAKDGKIGRIPGAISETDLKKLLPHLWQTKD